MRAMTTSVNARRLGQVGVDACLLALAYYLAYVLRFDSGIPPRYENLLGDTIALTVAMKLVIFAMFGLYSKLWRFVDQKDFESILKAVVVSTVGLIVVLFLFSIGKHDPPRGVLALDFLLSLVFVSGARFAVRAIVERPARGAILERAAHEVLIVGAGNGGQQVAFELRRNPGLRSAPVGFVDDDPRKQGMRIAGIKVLGAYAGPDPRARRRTARRGDHRHPVGAGHAAPARGHGLPRARHPGTHAAHDLRAAHRQREPDEAGPRGARGGRARP